MAKKKKKHSTHKRRRISGIGTGLKETAMLLLGATGGVLAGRFANSMVPNMSGTIAGGVEVGVGGLIAVKGGKYAIVKGLGVGIAANGLAYALGAKGLKVLPASMGYGPPGPMPYRSVSGYREVPKIGNFPRPNAIGRANNMEAARVARMYAGVYN